MLKFVKVDNSNDLIAFLPKNKDVTFYVSSIQEEEANLLVEVGRWSNLHYTHFNLQIYLSQESEDIMSDVQDIVNIIATSPIFNDYIEEK